jgi:hypothetical protein
LHQPHGRPTTFRPHPVRPTIFRPHPVRKTTTLLYRKFGRNGYCLPGGFKGWSRNVWSARYRCRCYYNPRDCRWYYFYPRCRCFLPWSCITVCPPSQELPADDDTVIPPSEDDTLVPPDSVDDPTNGDSDDGDLTPDTDDDPSVPE